MGKVSGLSAGLVWARSLVCQQVWCGQGLWSVSRSGVGKVSGLSADLVWARSLFCQQVWCGQGLWSVSRSGVGKVSGETMTSLHTHTQVVMTTEVEYLITSMIVAYGHVSPMPAGHSMVTKSSIGAEGV